jgi:hypothetical protein
MGFQRKITRQQVVLLQFIHTVLLQWMVEWRFSCVICFLFDCLMNIIHIPVYTMCFGFTI